MRFKGRYSGDMHGGIMSEEELKDYVFGRKAINPKKDDKRDAKRTKKRPQS